MSIAVGYKVKFINENLEGEIIALLPKNKLLVACSDGFDHEVPMNEVIVIGDDNQHSYSIDEDMVSSKITLNNNKPEQRNSILSKYLHTNKFNHERTLEIDLHLEKLVEFPEKLDDWHRLHTQMQHVKKCLNAAMEKKIQKIVFIHGVGTGVLKTELLNYLAGFENITVKEADFREYGVGASEVIIKNS